MLRAVSKALFAILLAQLVSACGDRPSGEDLRPDGTQPPPVVSKPGADSNSLQGFVNMGVLAGAKVSVFEIAGSAVQRENPLVSGVTNERGFYRLSLDNIHLGKPALIVVESLNDGSTTMKCDLRKGCDNDVGFGEVYSLADDALTLRLVSPSLQTDRFHNVSVFSSIAAERFENQLNQNFSQSELQILAKRTNAETANRFGLFGDLVELDLAVLSEPLVDQSMLAFRHALLNIAVVEAQRERAPNVTVGRAVESVISNLSFGVNSLNPDGSQSIDLHDVLTEAEEMIPNLNRDLGLAVHPRAIFISSEFAAEAASLAQKEPGSDINSTGVVSDTLFAETIDQGKGIVSEIRQIGGSLDLAALSRLADINIDTIIDIENSPLYTQFLGQAAAAKLSNSLHIDRSIDAFLKVIEASLTVIVDEEDRGSDDLVERQIINSDNGVMLAYTRQSENDRLFEVTQELNVCDDIGGGDQLDCEVLIDLSIQLDSGISFSRQTDRERFRVGFDLNSLNIFGRFEVGDKQISLLRETLILADSLTIEFEDSTVEDSSVLSRSLLYFLLQAENFSAELHTLFELSDSNSAESLQQLYAVSAGVLQAIFEQNDESDRDNLIDKSNTYWLVDSAEHLSGTVSGQVVDASENRSSYAINITSDAKGEVYTFETRTETTCTLSETGEEICVENELDIPAEEASEFAETDERFLDASYHFVFDSQFSGIKDPVLATLGGTRLSKDENSLVVSARYPGHHVTMEGDIDITSQIQVLDAINQDGSRLFITKPDGKERDGSVVAANGEVVAPVVDMGEWLKIPFADGFFQSL